MDNIAVLETTYYMNNCINLTDICKKLVSKTIAKELALMERIKAHLEDGKMAKSFDDINDEDEQQWLESYNLLTYKPVIFAIVLSFLAALTALEILLSRISRSEKISSRLIV